MASVDFSLPVLGHITEAAAPPFDGVRCYSAAAADTREDPDIRAALERCACHTCAPLQALLGRTDAISLAS